MSISQSLLPEFEHEMSNTRKVLERIPVDKLDWRIHAKSNTIGWVATHLANIPGWTVLTLEQDAFDLDPVDGKPHRPDSPQNKTEILELFDQKVAGAKQAIERCTDEQFMKPWTLLNHGQELFTMPKIAVIRSFVMNHSIHHRAHLCVYLRVNDVPVPGLYGPSADETDF